MQANIHPKFYEDVIVTCSCGNTFKTGSVRKDIMVEVCSKCHPFYTGELKFLDTQGNVEKFLKREKAATTYKKDSKGFKKRGNQDKKTKSLKELLGET
ncbi:50S ribosomal protein L31 [Candidatus Roizmanbacteria bacterium CG11_big_fil_rev_8_21_14_0_20_36_8]|uniref:Large ribosomal subunit protein bL31 n=2 Tax=Candidatus Roizmaniibacteriota TaxID=1752723 RepID=A0A2M6IUE2_9BACT|nr:MAG: 50S ribosomal protein L31 [Candidatus Roizmanbacteria bacterium CG11_big_fil_rev_8_21_14_0_20_36_8]PIZ65901.1 MAG: 50S ribosomal protein L31 [Candidatus Roizmanbacteria bacterium CG_4_10_14_0_2_um_filter_36_9]